MYNAKCAASGYLDPLKDKCASVILTVFRYAVYVASEIGMSMTLRLH